MAQTECTADTKICSKCGILKDICEFPIRSDLPGRRLGFCKSCRNEYRRTAYRIVRTQLISLYGGKCVCCGISQEQFLTIDHIQGAGGKHRKSAGGALSMYLSILREGHNLEKYRVLCWNCNMALAHFSFCHTTE